MATEFPYVISSNSLRRFLKGIPDRAVPPKMSMTYLKSIGFKSGNDSRLIVVLKFINFLDSSGTPTEAFKKFRNKTEGPVVLGQQITQAYSGLYQTYDNAHLQNEQMLRNYFSENMSAAATTINLVVTTYKVLCEFATFGKSENVPNVPQKNADFSESSKGQGLPVAIHLNLQIQLPISKDPDIYDSIFEAFAKHMKNIR